MFFRDGGGVYHAAMFLKWKKGHAVMVHSPGSGERVRRDQPVDEVTGSPPRVRR